MKKNKNNWPLIISLIVIFIGLVIAVTLVQEKTSLSSKASFDRIKSFQVNTPMTIRSGDDLKKAMEDLDTTDIDKLDDEMNSIGD